MNPRTVALASSVVFTGATLAQVSFQPAVHFPVGQEPVGAVLHDFTGDGLVDLLVATKQPDKLQIHPNLGEGFGPAIVTIEIGSDSPFGVALGDLDRDGDLDIVSSLEGSNEVIMILNTSSGWELGAREAVGDEPNGIVCADFNADGYADAACYNRSSGDVSVLINNRAGGFHPAVNHPIGPEPRGITAADITRDGRIDIAASSRDDRIVRILENVGGGQFQLNIDLGYGQFLEPHSLTTADMDRDGYLDIISVTHCNRCLTEPINVYLQYNGGNHWVGPVNGRLDGLAPTGVAVGDFDQDGIIDAASSNADSNDVSVCRNAGIGIFNLPHIYAVGVNPSVILSGDVDGNLTPDLVTLNTDGNDVSVLLNAIEPPCEADCDGDTICDPDEIENGAQDCNGDGIPDECQPDRCRADIAPPLGVLNVFDFLAYQSAFSESSPCADLATPIGVFNVFDFLTFQTRFSQGC